MSDNFMDMMMLLVESPWFWVALALLVMGVTLLIGHFWLDDNDTKLERMEAERSAKQAERMEADGESAQSLEAFYQKYDEQPLSTPERMDTLNRGESRHGTNELADVATKYGFVIELNMEIDELNMEIDTLTLVDTLFPTLDDQHKRYELPFEMILSATPESWTHELNQARANMRRRAKRAGIEFELEKRGPKTKSLDAA